MFTDSYSFLDIQPLSPGHALVIPKEHATKFHELSDETLADLLPVTKKVAAALGVNDYNILNNNGTDEFNCCINIRTYRTSSR